MRRQLFAASYVAVLSIMCVRCIYCACDGIPCWWVALVFALFEPTCDRLRLRAAAGRAVTSRPRFLMMLIIRRDSARTRGDARIRCDSINKCVPSLAI